MRRLLLFGLVLCSSTCAKPIEQQRAAAPSEAVPTASNVQECPGCGTTQEGRCTLRQRDATESFAFNAQLAPDGRLELANWPLASKIPKSLKEMEMLWDTGQDPLTPRPAATYAVRFQQGVSIEQANVFLVLLSSKGFVHVVVQEDTYQVAFFSDYVPADAPVVSDNKLGAITIFQFEDTLIVTSQILKTDGQKEIVEQQQFSQASVRDPACNPYVVDALRRQCKGPLQPCQRVTISGNSQLPFQVSLKALALLDTASPSANRQVSILDVPTKKNTEALRRASGTFSSELELKVKGPLEGGE